MDEAITANSAVFNGAVLKSMFSSDFMNSEHNTFKIVEPNNNPPLFSNYFSLINTIIVQYGYMQAMLKENNGTIALELTRCGKLINEIEKEL